MSELPVHSPKGASSAERWMNCAGSPALIAALKLPPSDETEYSAEGTAAHECAAHCLKNELDTWEVVGQKFYNIECTQEMADAVQEYLSVVRGLVDEQGDRLISHLVETRISADFSRQFYGTVDDAEIGEEISDINDFKYGVGIAVDPDNNAQLMYYAAGIFQKFRGGERVRLRIVQPRAHHVDGTVRVWETTRTAILDWLAESLIPAMESVATDLNPGDWCRFCPAKIACPVMTSLFGAAATANAAIVGDYSDAALGRNYVLVDVVKKYLKALEEEVYRRLKDGHKVPGAKLVPKRANRVFKEEAMPIFVEKFGDKVWEERELKSPAEMAKISPEAKSLVAEWAYSPNTGLTVALEDDKRPAVTIESAAATFAQAALTHAGDPAGGT